MKELKQELIESAINSKEYEWSITRVIEQTTINIVSAIAIGVIAGLLTVIGGVIYAGYELFLIVLHVSSGLTGILAFIFLGMTLMLVIITIAIIVWFRKLSLPILAFMIIGALIGSALGSALDATKKNSEGKVL